MTLPRWSDEAATAAAEVGGDCLVSYSTAFDTPVWVTGPMPDVADRADDDTAVIPG
ncbi:hypothetical protein ACFWOJ_24380 [Streptomyces sp. NPDC058439]|uniref:hypothetical protein n=1 Tax=Streptomyces sp. NPDC058439 TaxID=3346500 RepID=UPI0036642596